MNSTYKMRTTAKARKITILPSTVTNLRILSKSSFKNTHLGVSSPASVADTLQNKKKRTKLTGRFLVIHFFGQGQNEDGTIFRSQSRPVTPFSGSLFFPSGRLQDLLLQRGERFANRLLYASYEKRFQSI